VIFKDKKAIIFDLDGTLIDSIGIWNDVDRMLIKVLGGDDAEQVNVQTRRENMLRQLNSEKDPYREYCARLGEIYGCRMTPEEIVVRRYEISDSYLSDIIDYKPDADLFLKILKNHGFLLAIASTTRGNNMKIYRTRNRNILSKAPLDEYFSVIYSKDDATKSKPDPEIFLRIMADFSLKPEECLIFEDSLVGAEAAKASGAELAVIYDKYSDPDREAINRLADYNFASFAEAITKLHTEI